MPDLAPLDDEMPLEKPLLRFSSSPGQRWGVFQPRASAISRHVGQSG